MFAVMTMKRSYDEIGATTQLRTAPQMLTNYTEKRDERLRKRRRFVKFDDDVQQYDIEAHNTWLSNPEKQAIRERMKQDIRSIARSALRPGTLLNGSVFSPDSCSTAKSLERLKYWSKFIESGRGLESVIHSKLGSQRRQHRERVIRSVMIAQDVCRQNKNLDRDECLKLVSQEFSCVAQKHALLVGLADAGAVQTSLSKK